MSEGQAVQILYYGVGHPESVQRARAVWEEMEAVHTSGSPRLNFCFIGDPGALTGQGWPGWSVLTPPVEIRESPRELGQWVRSIVTELQSDESIFLADTFPSGREHELERDGLHTLGAVWLATHLSGEWSTHLRLRGWPGLSGYDILWCESGGAPDWLCQMAPQGALGIQCSGPVLDFDQKLLLSRREARKQLGLRDGDFAVACAAFPSAEYRRRVANVLRQFGEVWRLELPAEASDGRSQFRFFWNSAASSSLRESTCLRAYDLFLGHFDYQYAYRISSLLTPSIGYLEPNDPTGARERLVSLGYLRRPLQRLATTELACVTTFREILSSTRATRHASVAGTMSSVSHQMDKGTQKSNAGAGRVASYLLNRLLG